MDTAVFSALIKKTDTRSREQIAATLAKFGEPALRVAARTGIRIHALGKRDRFDDASLALKRLGVDVDSWPAPPAGLYVVEERTVYLRSRSEMTVAHEFGHALDACAGGGVYLSTISPELRKLFADARAFITPYAATGTDEFMAENIRAYVECNDPSSFWPRATRERLQRIDAKAYAFIERFFASFESG